ncbi:pimeloyl-ACP methyl ester carboxylesterase [Paenibacillus rhizosphaerae]|uniref:Pimeloyl-ACP methyl ester carboxylesterase n=1 Tax=Paenibacillus rhizosphaerae TaxID=297318 RepID=A0A839TY98_9BACL|nr:pimeloyl-ACP methyl ester carboxylesterase [Paenibacillus rhizosphaerae]
MRMAKHDRYCAIKSPTCELQILWFFHIQSSISLLAYPSFGYSSMPSITDFSYTFEQFSLMIEQLLDQLSIPQFILYCHDYGGPVGFTCSMWELHIAVFPIPSIMRCCLIKLIT